MCSGIVDGVMIVLYLMGKSPFHNSVVLLSYQSVTNCSGSAATYCLWYSTSTTPVPRRATWSTPEMAPLTWDYLGRSSGPADSTASTFSPSSWMVYLRLMVTCYNSLFSFRLTGKRSWLAEDFFSCAYSPSKLQVMDVITKSCGPSGDWQYLPSQLLGQQQPWWLMRWINRELG